MARFSPAAEGNPFCRQWFCLRQQGGKTEPTTAQRVWKAWGAKLVRLSSLGGRDIDFPLRIRGLCLQALCSSMLSYDCVFLLWEVFWDAQAVVSCQEIVVSGLHAIIFLSVFSTLMAGLNFLGSFPVAVRILWCANRFLWGFFPCRKGQHREHRQKGCPILKQALSQGHHHTAKPRWLQAGQDL